jgi:hypothetical protein
MLAIEREFPMYKSMYVLFEAHLQKLWGFVVLLVGYPKPTHGSDVNVVMFL